MPRFALLVNTSPRAGESRARAAAASNVFVKQGVDVLALTAPSREELIAKAVGQVEAGIDALVACGGDGMVNLAVQALAGTDTPLGIVSAGTGCDFARALGLEREDPAAAARTILDAHTRPCDLIRSDYGWCASVLNAGFDSRATQRAAAMTWPKGPRRYDVATYVELARLAPLDFRVTLDDGPVDIRATLVAVGNTSYYGGGMKICPDADPTDGLLDVVMVRALTRRRLVGAVPSLYRGTHPVDYAAEVEVRRSARVHIEYRGTGVERCTADGEILGPLPVTCQAVPGAVRILVPAAP